MATPATACRMMSHDSTQLWDFALSLYARDGVAEACLALQDEGGADICELLWVCWLASRGLMLADEAEQSLGSVRDWQRQFTYPLRAQRRALKPLVAAQPDVAPLRRTLKEAELLAERETLRQLQALTEHGDAVRPLVGGEATRKKNLLRLLPIQKKSLRAALQTLESHLDPPPLPR